MLSHKTEDEHTVGHLERVGVAEVEFVLAVAALVGEGVDIPAKLIHVADHRLEEPVGQHRGLQVVAPGWSVCHVLWHPGDDALVGVLEYVDLRLDSHVHPEADGCCLGDLVLQDAPEVMAVRLGMEVQVGRHHQPRRSRAALAPSEGSDHVDVRARAQDQILDEIDRRVIKILQDDGRRPNTEIARELHVSETTIRKRVSQLVSRGLINIVAVPTPRAVGMNLSAIIGISVTLPKLREISEELKRQKEVRYVGVSTGRYDIIVEAFFFDQQHFLDFISSKLSRMDGITSLETSMILEVVKFSYEWEIA